MAKASDYVYRVMRVPINEPPGYHEAIYSHPMASEPSLEEVIEVVAGRDGWDLYQLAATATFAILVFRRGR